MLVYIITFQYFPNGFFSRNERRRVQMKFSLYDKIDQISPPPFVKHVLEPQNEFGIQKIQNNLVNFF